jgi:adenine-specific DNA-methyltransferase
MKYRRLYRHKVPGAAGGTQFKYVLAPEGGVRELKPLEIANTKPEELLSHDNLTSQGNPVYQYQFKGKPYSGNYKPPPKSMDKLVAAGRVIALGKTLRFVRYLADFPYFEINELWDDFGISGFGEEKVYVVQTLPGVVERCILMTTDPGDLVLDPTCGSGTTAYVAKQWGRRWITTDTSRVALALARTRLMAARFPYYLLADSPEGRKKQSELTGQPITGRDEPGRSPDIHKGFVYRTVPHVTLKSIANNPDIKEGMTREEIDRAIAKHADTETLFDQPYEDRSVVRLSGPFTVESLSPHKALDATPEKQEAAAPRPGGSYHQTIRENLLKSGVKGTDKAQRIALSRLDPHPGRYIHAEGTTTDGTAVRVNIGPDSGTVGDSWIADAAVEAKKGSQCDLLLVCAFAFEGSVHEKTAELAKEMKLGNLRVLPVRMNPDLAMFGDDTGRELLKKTGAANLFTVFGEPDLKIDRDKAGKVTVTVRGVDVFDPATGEVRSGGTDDIACWFIDTDYDEKSFFVRHAYFLGADEPYEKLKKALKAEIDEGEWSKLYSATSQPFDPPSRGRIAVKVINHFGDEILKVCPVPTISASKGK